MKDDELSDADKRASLVDADRVFGLNLASPDDRASALCAAAFGQEVNESELSAEVQELVTRRNAARTEKRWEEADALRKEIEILGYSVEDSGDGLKIRKRS